MNKLYRIKEKSHFAYKIFIILIFYIWLYIGYLQIFMYNYFLIKSKNNYTRYKNIYGIRGSILDRNGLVIATTAPFIKLYWNKKPYKISENDRVLINFLQDNLKIELNEKDLLIKNNQSKFLLCENLSLENICIISENLGNQDRIILEDYTKRIYKYDNLACHAIGYIDSRENSGISGIEKICNYNLKGHIGKEKLIVNSIGSVLNLETIKQPIEGFNIKTTLDLKLQKIIEKIIPDNVSGSVIIMDPENGDIFALLSSPRYDPSIFLSKINNEAWEDLQNKKVLLNRCFQATYHPGSIFKLICTIAMLEEGIINTDTKWFCSGSFEYKNRFYSCVNKNGHGLIDIKDAVAYSCNIPFFINSISKLNIDLINKYANYYGLGQITESLFNEESGLIPSKNWKKKIFGEQWYTGETISVSIGQGSLTTTPIQLAIVISSIVTGFKVKPRILESEKIIKKSIGIKSESLNILKEGMHMASKKGSCKSLKNLKNWKIYGKTGTAQVCSMKLSKSNESDMSKKHHGLFACYAENKIDNKGFVIVIVIENCGSSSIPTSYAKRFFIEYDKIYNL